MKIKSLKITAFVLTLALNSCTNEDNISVINEDSPINKDSETSEYDIKQTEITKTYKVNRGVAVKNYNTYYLGSELNDCGWTGSISNCDAGSVPQTTHDKVIMRINYFRQLVSLNKITLDKTKLEKYQKTALMMSANNKLDHNPPNNWKCWSKEGHDGAGSSNISLYLHSTAAITNFMKDGGVYNADIGHRRWILHSTKTKFSYGTTDNAMSLGTIGIGEGNTDVPEFIAYPVNGYMPQNLVFPRWSFAIPHADFSKAEIIMKDLYGNKIDLDIESRGKIPYGDRTIVWSPKGIKKSDTDVTYTVTISGISGAPESTYTYHVTIIKL